MLILYRLLIDIVGCVGIAWFEFVEIKGAKIVWHVKSPTLRAAKLNGFLYYFFLFQFTLSDLVWI